MPLSKCSFSREGKTCRYEFADDGHSLCVSHRPCVREDWGYDPTLCVICTENVKFLKTVGKVDRLSHQFSSLKRSWEAVKRSARRKGVQALWRDASLRQFVLGRSAQFVSPSRESSSSRSSPHSPSPGGPLAGPSSSVLDSAAPPPPSVAAAPPTPPLGAATAAPPPPSPSGAGPSPPSSAEVDVAPGVRRLLTDLFAEFAASFRPPPAAPAPLAPPSPLPPVPSAAPSTPPSTAPPAPYVVESSPVSDVGADGDAGSGTDAEPDVGEGPALLPAGWWPVPPGWQVVPGELVHTILRPAPDRPNTLEPVPDQQARWGVSAYSSTPCWHFAPQAHQPPPAHSMPAPPFEEVRTTFSSLAALSTAPSPVVSADGEPNARLSLGLPWAAGQVEAFFRSVREWWPLAASQAQPSQPSRPAPRRRAPVVPSGTSWDAQMGSFLLSKDAPYFPPPLATPTTESLRTAEKARAAALEAFSGLSTLIGMESLLRRLSDQPALASSLSGKTVCDLVLPLLRSAVWQLAPSSSAEVGRAMSCHLAAWRQAVAPLPPAAQAALLAVDPVKEDFGTARAVADALARAPQVAVVYRGQSSSRSAPPRGRSAPPPRPPPPPPRSTSGPRRSRREVRHHPYGQRPSRPAASSTPRLPLQGRDAPPSARRQEQRPFRAPSSTFRGARR